MIDIQKPIVPFGGSLWLQLVMNLVPFLGVVFYDWSVFALLYSFWLETLALSFFDAVRIAFAAGSNSEGPFIFRAFRFFLGRAGILLFYMVFMIVFVGVIVSGKQTGNNFGVYLFLADDSFRITILTFFVIKFSELIYRYFIKGEYKTALPEQFTGFLNRQLIVIHVVIVLGVFAFQFVSEKVDDHTGIVAFAGVFILIKSLADMIGSRLGNAKTLQ